MGSLAAATRLGHFRTVASLALNGCRFVKQHFGVAYYLEIGMAQRAADVLMHALQREFGAAVIKQRRLPLVGVVARRAFGGRRPVGELTGVNIAMTLFASARRLSEIDVNQAGFKVRRPVAIRASDGTVGPGQNETGGSVIEA